MLLQLGYIIVINNNSLPAPLRLAVCLCVLVLLGSAHELKAQTIGLNFTGTSLNESGFRPPDTMGTVGSNHIIEMINGRYRVYDKTTGGELADSSLNSFWATAGAPHAGSFSFDPRVQYDPSVGRFYATSVDNSRNANNILFAVSKTGNPLDGWDGFRSTPILTMCNGPISLRWVFQRIKS